MAGASDDDDDGIVGGCDEEEPSSQEDAAAAPGKPAQDAGGQAGKRGAGRAAPGCKGTGKKNRKDRRGSGGRPAAVKAGMKECLDCKVWKPLVEYKPGSAICSSPCFRVKDNVWKACKAEGCLEWYNEQRADQAKWKKVVRWYTIQCPGDLKSTSKMKTFPVLQYQAKVSSDYEQIRDGIMEMMHEVAFVHWASKPKNKPPRGMTQEEARQEFRRLVSLEDSIVDFDGPSEEFRQRIGVRSHPSSDRSVSVRRVPSLAKCKNTIKKDGTEHGSRFCTADQRLGPNARTQCSSRQN